MSVKDNVDWTILEDFERHVGDHLNVEGYLRDHTNEEAKYRIREYYKSNNIEVDVTTWVRLHDVKDEMVYKNAYSKQICFIRDTIGNMVGDRRLDYGRRVNVVGTHMSKSILLPVYQIKTLCGSKITINYNFYNYVISIEAYSDVDLTFSTRFILPINVMDNVNPSYCYGFKPEDIHGAYANNNKKFTFTLDNEYDVYTFFYLLKNLGGI